MVVGAEDFTVMGGSIGPGNHAKRVRLASLAAQERVPLVMLFEGAGTRSEHAYERTPFAPTDLQALAQLSGVVPTVAVVMGPCAGRAAQAVPLLDFVVMVEGAALFGAGPPLVAATTGEEVSREELGGADMHGTVSGVVHNVVADDHAALRLVRGYLSYLPTNAWSTPPTVDAVATEWVEDLLDEIPPDPGQPYSVERVIELVADPDTVLAVQPRFGRGIVTAFGRIGGAPVAFVANDPAVAGGVIDADAADKAAHFIDVCGAFQLPVVFLADTPGVLTGSQAERSGILRHAARLYAAQVRCPSPMLHVTMRRAFGLGAALMGADPSAGQSVTLALPGARRGPLPADSGAAAANRASDVDALIEHGDLGGAYATADDLGVDDVIDPRELRAALGAALRLSRSRRATEPDVIGIHPIRP